MGRGEVQEPGNEKILPEHEMCDLPSCAVRPLPHFHLQRLESGRTLESARDVSWPSPGAAQDWLEAVYRKIREPKPATQVEGLDLGRTRASEVCDVSPGADAMIWEFTGLPMPPTSNNQYIPVKIKGFTRLVPSHDLKAFKANFVLSVMGRYRQEKKEIQEWVARGSYLDIEVKLYFMNEKLFNKQGGPKRLDATNRVKALHDSFSDFLEIDDLFFFRSSVEKLVGTREEVQITARIL